MRSFEFVKKYDWHLIGILAIAAFFRFYKFTDLQYWSGDEELLTATIRHIIWDRSPTLIVQNANLGFGLGPFYHYFLTPFYFISNFNLVALQSIASILGIITTYVVYLIGFELQGRKLALFSSFVYASSFLISLYDRRLWHLTPDSFLLALSTLILVRLVKGKKHWGFLVAIPIGFAFHSDASLVVVLIATVFVFLIRKLKFSRKDFFLSAIILFIFASPLVLADVRYNGAIHKPIIQSLTKPLKGEGITSHNFRYFKFQDLTKTLSKVVFTFPSNFIEQEFCYCETPKAPLGVIGTILISIVLLLNIIVFKKKKLYKGLDVIWLMLASLFIGILIFNYIFKGNFYQHYFVIAMPIFAILFGVFLNEVSNKNKHLIAIFLLSFLTLNIYSFIISDVKYPLKEKIKLVQSSRQAISNDKFALYVSSDPYVQGGGWTELYTLGGAPAVKSYWYDYWDWIYQAYSLFPGPIQKEDPEKIVVIQKSGENLVGNRSVISKNGFEDIELFVIDNSAPKKF